MGEKERPMFNDFKKLSKKEWANNATSDLKGTDVYEKYSWQLDGLTLDPYYDGSDLEKIKKLTEFENRLYKNNDPSGEPRVWANIQKIGVKDLKTANKEALEALNNGADGIELDCSEVSKIDFDLLLSNIKLNYCQVSLTNATHDDSCAFLKRITKGSPLMEVFVSTIGQDNLDSQLQLIELSKHQKEIKCIEISAIGDTITEQVSNLLLSVNRNIRNLHLGGLNVETAINPIYVTTKIGTDFFVEIAKIRAIRNLFFQIARSYDHNSFLPEDLHIKCISTAWLEESYQPNANMLKSSTAAMAAILGGCNSLVVEPENNDGTLTTRIARNVSLVLKEESFLSKTADPVAGSYYIESLTDQLAQSAWKLFQKKLETTVIEH
ncbi:MAG TPA: methylmalonyl-CoA mutase family protein [Fulvivirga sp.]|nr:methylmalonyl-CoA mutase family protein [Fulvivirga sp.]